MLASSRMLSTSPYAAALPAPAAPTMICALASSAASADAGPNAKIVASTCTVADVAVSAITAVYTPAITSGVNLASVTIAVASPEPSSIAIDPCAVLGIVAHAVTVFVHKHTVTLGGPVTGDLRGPCRTAAQRIACASQPCGTRASPRAIYLGVIRGTRLRIQATGRCGRLSANPSARSLTDKRGAGCGHRNCGSKGHCSYQGDCRHVRVVTLMPSFHLAPLSTCLGRRLVLRGAFVPFTLNTIRGSVSLHVILNIFDQPRKTRGTQGHGVRFRPRSKLILATSRHRLDHGHPPPVKRPRCRPFPCFSNFGARIFLAPRSRYSPRNFRMSGSAMWGASSLRRSQAFTTHLRRPSRTMPTRSASLWASTKS